MSRGLGDVYKRQHEMGFAKEVANRCMFFYDGVINEEGAPEEFFGNPKSERLKDFLSKVL